MAAVIFKYELNPIGKTSFRMPINAQIVKFAFQDGKPFVWAIVGTEPQLERIEFLILGTGFIIPENAHYIDTAFIDHYVWHLFIIEND